MSYSSQAHLYANKYGTNADEKGKLYNAVIYGQSLRGSSSDSSNDTIINKAFDYAMSFRELSTEEKFRIQQAVRYGATLLIENNNTMADNQHEITDNTPMPFGKHKGKAMVNIPAQYLLWLYNEGCSHTGVKKYIIDNLDGLRKEAGLSKTKY